MDKKVQDLDRRLREAAETQRQESVATRKLLQLILQQVTTDPQRRMLPLQSKGVPFLYPVTSTAPAAAPQTQSHGCQGSDLSNAASEDQWLMRPPPTAFDRNARDTSSFSATPPTPNSPMSPVGFREKLRLRRSSGTSGRNRPPPRFVISSPRDAAAAAAGNDSDSSVASPAAVRWGSRKRGYPPELEKQAAARPFPPSPLPPAPIAGFERAKSVPVESSPAQIGPTSPKPSVQHLASCPPVTGKTAAPSVR